MKYLAKSGRVWRRIGTTELLGSELGLKEGENIRMFEQVFEPKPTEKPGRGRRQSPPPAKDEPEFKFDQ